MTLKIVKEVEGLKSNGHYALAVVDGGQVFISGQFSIDPVSGKKIFGSVETELKQVLSNVERILKHVGSNKQRVLKTTIYVTDIDDWPIVDQTYAEFFMQHTPARTVVPVKALHYGFKVEVEVVARCE